MQDKTGNPDRVSPGEISGQTRCLCNKLICVINGSDIEIKCNKCKRMVVIRTKGITGVEFK